MDVKQRNDNKGGAFYMEADGKEIAQMHYVYAGEKRMIIDHTEVANEYEGKGLGRQLVKAGVEYARQKEMKIIPLCPYAKQIFEKTPEYADVLA
ncbi:MAG: N-acetyltransferase [Taibaiella sp.]|nr:N-acetyltransferase [Taibaiella sp.]